MSIYLTYWKLDQKNQRVRQTRIVEEDEEFEEFKKFANINKIYYSICRPDLSEIQ